jgi:hypothetical protein
MSEAEPQLIAGYEGMNLHQKSFPAGETPSKRLANAADRLIDLYNLWDKPELANKWRKEREFLTTPHQ